MYKVPIDVLKDCKDLLLEYQKESVKSTTISTANKKKTDKLIKLLQENYLV